LNDEVVIVIVEAKLPCRCPNIKLVRTRWNRYNKKLQKIIKEERLID